MKNSKGGVIALFIFLLAISIFGFIFLFPKKTETKASNDSLIEEYDPEEVRVEKITLKNETYYSFKGIYEKYADFIEEEIKDPEDYEDYMTAEEFEKISAMIKTLADIEGTWIKAEENELLEFFDKEFPNYKKEEVKKYLESLLKNEKTLENEEIDEYILLSDLVLD